MAKKVAAKKKPAKKASTFAAKKGPPQAPKPKLATGSTAVKTTGPIPVSVEQELTGQERVAEPWWSTFCGVTNGCWYGRAAAFSPSDGEPEPMALDGDRRPVYDMHTLNIEQRDAVDGVDRVERRTMRAQSPEQLAAALPSQSPDAQPSSSSSGSDASAWEHDVIADDEEGLVFFDGGAFSRGPFRLTHAVLEGEAASAVEGGAMSEEAHSAASNGAGASEITDDIAELSIDAEAAPQDEDLDWDLDEGLDQESDGLPPDLPEDLDAPAASTGRKTSVIEQCVTLGGEERIRMQVTVAATGGTDGVELDVELLRIALYSESWEGLSGGICAHTQSQPRAELTQAARLLPQDLQGSWQVFGISGIPITETDVLTGAERKINVFHSQETQQRWEPPALQPSNDGGTLWLPGQVLLQLSMSPPVEGAGRNRGIIISFSWMARDNMLIGVQREYDAAGELLEVRTQTAIRDGWVGGRM
ncbi:hypothetical protein WJX72_003812 [[Myrmecia] bisecta]|uniref:Uncharacterized protein n=1 Tax=[Myrmecia] bisecta TaxID=41462 RepID=A0AAW1P6V2_9CHLO